MRPVCSAAGGSGERGRGTLRARDDCLVSLFICVSFPRMYEDNGSGVVAFLRCAGVGAGRLDDRVSFFLEGSVTSATGLATRFI